MQTVAKLTLFVLSTVIAATSAIWLRNSPQDEALTGCLIGIAGLIASAAWHTTEDVLSRRESHVTTLLHGSPTERQRFVGDWLGSGRDAKLPRERTALNAYSNVRLHLDGHHDSMNGTFALDVTLPDKPDPVHLNCDVEMIAVCGDYVLLRFAMNRFVANHFGVLFLQISDAGNSLSGYFLKKRVFAKPARLGLGEFELKRQA